MKEFRKTKERLFICEECGRIFLYKKTLSQHINWYHDNKKYYDEWIKEKGEEICKICGNDNIFLNFKKGYKNGCCKKHMNKLAYEVRKNSLLKKYGIENPFQLEKIKEKSKETRLKKYGDEHYTNLEKSRQTCLEKYGVEYSFQSRNIRNKSKNTMLIKYGVENAAQNIDIYNKGLKTRFLIHKFRDTNLWYQGTYELDFLNKYYDKFDNIQRGPSIKYIFSGKNKVYFPDFYIPLLNLIIEIKSSWTLEIDAEIEEKKKATISNGFNYLMILDKNYNEFSVFLKPGLKPLLQVSTLA